MSVLDQPEDSRPAYDAARQVVELARDLFDAPIALLSIAGDVRTRVHTVAGLDLQAIANEFSVTRYLVDQGPGAVVVVEDGRSDIRVQNHPLVIGAEGLRSFIGATVCDRHGTPVGAISVMDRQPRGPLTAREEGRIRRLADLAGAMFDRSVEHQQGRARVETLELAEQMAAIGHFRLQADTGDVTWSDEVFRIHGFEPGAFRPVLGIATAFYDPDDAAVLKRLVETALRTGEGYDARLRLIRKDGEARVVQVRARCEIGDSGQTSALFGVLQDITDAVRADEERASRDAVFRMMSETATDIIARYDVDGTLIYVSPSVKTILGRNPEDMVGQPCSAFMHPDDVQPTQARVLSYLAQNEDEITPHIEYRALRPDGSLVWLEASPRAVRVGGVVVELHDHVRDISARKSLETDLIEARDKAEEAAQAKATFLANMSHEIRTPLTSVVGFSGLLRSSLALPEQERGWVERVSTASAALLDVINDILDYSKLEVGAITLEAAGFDPRRVVTDAVALFEFACQAKGVSLLCEIDPDLPSGFLGDAQRLRQVLLNLLSNAVKFTADGSIRLSASIQQKTGFSQRLRIAVSDSGIGIASDKLDFVFDRFTQADASTTRSYGGTGLGLAISFTLIEQMGGQMGVESEQGIGSTFWLEVDLVPVEMMPEGVEPPVQRTTTLNGARLLLADDNPANRELIVALLKPFDFAIDVVEHGAQAVEAATAVAYDAILMDVNMPVMDGLEATRHIRLSGSSGSHVPIIGLTANVQKEQVDHYLSAGMTSHVGKPIQIHLLLQALDDALTVNGEDLEQRITEDKLQKNS